MAKKTYFISNGTLVKIGRSNNPAKRSVSLQNFTPDRITTLLVLDYDCESELHERFAKYRVVGEWFRICYDILMFISEHTHQPPRMSFKMWLEGQRNRFDDIGRFAVIAKSDRHFPNSNRLKKLHQHYVFRHQDHLRAIMREAYFEWRRECADLPIFPNVDKDIESEERAS